MKALLIPVNGGPPVEIVKELTLVGRQENCDVQLDHKTVSKLHCVLVKADGLVVLRDLGSTNGCRLNGQRIKRGALLPNDVLSIAAFEYRVYLQPDNGGLGPAVEEGGERTEMLAVDDLLRGGRGGDKSKPVGPKAVPPPLPVRGPLADPTGAEEMPDADD